MNISKDKQPSLFDLSEKELSQGQQARVFVTGKLYSQVSQCLNIHPFN
jgi:hypothetical protein